MNVESKLKMAKDTPKIVIPKRKKKTISRAIGRGAWWLAKSPISLVHQISKNHLLSKISMAALMVGAGFQGVDSFKTQTLHEYADMRTLEREMRIAELENIMQSSSALADNLAIGYADGAPNDVSFAMQEGLEGFDPKYGTPIEQIKSLQAWIADFNSKHTNKIDTNFADRILSATVARGSDLHKMLTMVLVESEMIYDKPTVGNGNARGQFMYMPDTWRIILARGDVPDLPSYYQLVLDEAYIYNRAANRLYIKDDILDKTVLDWRYDPLIAAMVWQTDTPQRAQAILAQGRKQTLEEEYLIYMQGEGNYKSFIQALKANPNQAAADILQSASADPANAYYFYQNGIDSRKLTMQESYNRYVSRVRVKSRDAAFILTYGRGQVNAQALPEVEAQAQAQALDDVEISAPVVMASAAQADRAEEIDDRTLQEKAGDAAAYALRASGNAVQGAFDDIVWKVKQGIIKKHYPEDFSPTDKIEIPVIYADEPEITEQAAPPAPVSTPQAAPVKTPAAPTVAFSPSAADTGSMRGKLTAQYAVYAQLDKETVERIAKQDFADTALPAGAKVVVVPDVKLSDGRTGIAIRVEGLNEDGLAELNNNSEGRKYFRLPDPA